MRLSRCRITPPVQKVCLERGESLPLEFVDEDEEDDSDYLDVVVQPEPIRKTSTPLKQFDGLVISEAPSVNRVETPEQHSPRGEIPPSPGASPQEEAIKQIVEFGPVYHAKRQNEHLRMAHQKMLQQYAPKDPSSLMAINLKLARKLHDNLTMAKQKELSVMFSPVFIIEAKFSR